MKVELYLRDRRRGPCRYCEQAQAWLANRADLDTTIYEVGIDLTREELFEKFPEVQTMPVVVVDGVWIGGYTELANSRI